MVAPRTPRSLHPGAWWLWALGLATAAGRTTNPILLLLIIAVACLVVTVRRSTAPWALSFRMYLWVAGLIVVLRVVFRIVFNGQGFTVLLTLPTLQLPQWFWGATLLGPVSAEAVLSALYDGLNLAAMIVCIGAANALANPKRLLACVPSALAEISTVLVVAMSVFPQLAESVVRVKRARSLRVAAGEGRRAQRKVLRGIVIPVLADALDRSLLLAAAMDSRGYGRRRQLPRHVRVLTGLLLLTGILGLMVGVYATLDGTTPRYLGGPLLIAGVLVAAVGIRLAGRRSSRTRYRPDRWGPAEIGVAGLGIITAATLFRSEYVDPEALYPSVFPPQWPTVALLPAVGVLVAVLAAAIAPPAPGVAPSRSSSTGTAAVSPGRATAVTSR